MSLWLCLVIESCECALWMCTCVTSGLQWEVSCRQGPFPLLSHNRFHNGYLGEIPTSEIPTPPLILRYFIIYCVYGSIAN